MRLRPQLVCNLLRLGDHHRPLILRIRQGIHLRFVHTACAALRTPAIHMPSHASMDWCVLPKCMRSSLPHIHYKTALHSGSCQHLA